MQLASKFCISVYKRWKLDFHERIKIKERDKETIHVHNSTKGAKIVEPRGYGFKEFCNSLV